LNISKFPKSNSLEGKNELVENGAAPSSVLHSTIFGVFSRNIRWTFSLHCHLLAFKKSTVFSNLKYIASSTGKSQPSRIMEHLKPPKLAVILRKMPVCKLKLKTMISFGIKHQKLRFFAN
jgi:hypothetical protein